MTRNTRWLPLLISLTLLPPPAAGAQWVVTDPGNLVQSIISALQDVNAVLKQIEQYKTQIDQYTAQLRDLAAPAVWVWDLGVDTVQTAESVQRKLSNYKQLLKDTNASLSQLGDPDYYKNSPCYNKKAVTSACGSILQALHEQQQKSLQTQHQANEAMFQSLDAQHASMGKRLDRLKTVMETSQGAEGQMQVLQAANELTSAQIAELMEIRSLMITQQNIAVEAKREELARKAAGQAASASFFAGEHKPTPAPKGW